MKKIGILTFHRMNNIGAVLQAFATQEYIKEVLDKSDEVKIVDYYPNNRIVRRGNRKLIKAFRFVKRMVGVLLNPYVGVKDWRFCQFRRAFYNLTKKSYYGDSDIFKNPPTEFDLLVSGSDQILNSSLSGNSQAYYLSFPTSAKKISYASSFGRTNISEEEKTAIRNELSKFDEISVREDVGIEIVKREIGRDAVLTLDPVFLLSEEKWRSLERKNRTLPLKYVFVYAMENSESLHSLVKAVRNYYKLPVIFSYWKNQKNTDWDQYDYWCGPREFLNYVDNASIVITNSFHGLAFSIIFKKKFYCVAHSSRNVRLESMLRLTQNIGKLFPFESCVPSEIERSLIDGEQCYKSLDSHIARSQKYLQEALKLD